MQPNFRVQDTVRGWMFFVGMIIKACSFSKLLGGAIKNGNPVGHGGMSSWTSELSKWREERWRMWRNWRWH